MEFSATYKQGQNGQPVDVTTKGSYANGIITFTGLNAHGGVLVVSIIPSGTRGSTAGVHSSETNT